MRFAGSSAFGGRWSRCRRGSGILRAARWEKIVGDVIVTRDEIAGLMSNLLFVDAPPAGTTRLTDWAKERADTLGRHYANELSRRK